MNKLRFTLPDSDLCPLCQVSGCPLCQNEQKPEPESNREPGPIARAAEDRAKQRLRDMQHYDPLDYWPFTGRQDEATDSGDRTRSSDIDPCKRAFWYGAVWGWAVGVLSTIGLLVAVGRLS
jgi:hypothetical protein